MNAHTPFDAKQDWTNPYCQNSSNDPMVDALLGNAYHVVRTVYCNLGNLKLLYDFLNQYGMVIGVNSEEELKALSTQVKYSRIYGFSRAGDRQVTDYLYVEGDRTGILPNDTTATGSWITVATSGSSGGGTSSGEGAYIPWVYANGSAAGGETTINVPDGTVGVPFIIINGDMQYVGRGFEFNVDSLSVTLAQPLEEGDEVVFLLTGVPAVPDNPNVNDWIQINWLYNNGAAVGGEQVIAIPYTFQSVPAVYKNGLRLYKGLSTESYTADPDNQRIFLTEPLATNDRLIVQLGGEATVIELSDRTIQEVARAVNAEDSVVILSSNLTDSLNGKEYLYSVSGQKIFKLPSLPTNVYISTVIGNQLTYVPGNVTVKMDTLQEAEWKVEGDIRGWDMAGDGVTDDTPKFQKLEEETTGIFIDLRGLTYFVTEVPKGNKYINGYFRCDNKLLPDADFPEKRLQTRKSGYVSGFRPSLPNHVKSGLLLATLKNTTIQGAVLDYYDNILYVLQNVSGTVGGNDEVNKIVAYNWFGQNNLVPLWETKGSQDLGHQCLGLTIGRNGFRNTRGQLQIWGLAGVSKGANRHKYIMRCTPASGEDITPEFFQIWDDTYVNHVNVLCTDPMSNWLITTAKRYVGPGEEVGVPDQMRYYVKVYDTSKFINPDLYGYDYQNEATFEFEIADFVRDMQAVACDGTAIYFCQAGSAYSSTRKYLHKYSLDGTYLGVQQIQAGASRAYEIADPSLSGTPTGDLRYEPEAMFFRMIAGGYDLVMGNTNGIPDGDTERETSFYTLTPQQTLHVKTTSSLLPGIVIDAAHDICTNSGLLSFGKLGDGGSITEQAHLDDNGFTVAKASTAAARYDAQNSIRHVTFHVSTGGDAGIYDFTNTKWLFKSPTPLTGLAFIGQPVEVDGPVRPFTTNTYSSGTATRLWTTVYATNGTINTSDERHKTAPLKIETLSKDVAITEDAILDAWGDVNLIVYQWLSSVEEKGKDKARWHFGVIAQQVRDAFLAHGIDGTRFGLLCYDEWEDEYRPITAVRDVEVTYIDGDGVKHSYTKKEEYDTGEVELVMAAGNRWGIRPDECLWLEAAYQRRRCDRIEERLAALEKR